jgi:glutathione S-transferase
MVIVHHLNHSRSQRVLWLLEELGIRYEVKYYRRDPVNLSAPRELRKVHPLGKSPVVVDGEVTLAESGAIIEYLVERHGGLRLSPPPGTPDRLRYQYWMHCAEGSAMPLLSLKLIFDRMEAARMPFFAHPIARAIAERALETVRPNLTRMLKFMEAELAKRPWFAGESFTAADIQMSFPVEAAQTRGALDERYPWLLDWLGRIHARPAYQRALESGREYDLVR